MGGFTGMGCTGTLLGASWATGMATSDRGVTRGGAAGDTMDGDKVAGDTATGR